MELTEKVFGTVNDQEVRQFTISNNNGVCVQLLSYGATLSSVRMPDRHGKIDEVTLGLDSLESYLGRHPYLGTTLGRVANRIANGEFVLDGHRYTLARNDGGNHLHGGVKGFDKAIWHSSTFKERESIGVIFRYKSKDGEEGYPGNLDVRVIYALNEADTIGIRFEAQSDRATPVNLSNHAYWNLKGPGSGDIKDHLVTIYAEAYLPVDERLIPTGELKSVNGTPYDFRSEKRIGKDLDAIGGYDVCYVLKGTAGRLREAARVFEGSSGRGILISTTQPGMQFYSGHLLDGLVGRGGKRFLPNGAFAMETEGFPDAVNKPAFPSIVLRPGEAYVEETQFGLFRD